MSKEVAPHSQPKPLFADGFATVGSEIQDESRIISPQKEIVDGSHTAGNRIGLAIICYWVGVIVWSIYQANRCENNSSTCWDGLLIYPLVGYGLIITVVLCLFVIMTHPKKEK